MVSLLIVILSIVVSGAFVKAVFRHLGGTTVSRALDKAERHLLALEAEAAQKLVKAEPAMPRVMPLLPARKPRLGDRGATPTHYRAFSVVQHRLGRANLAILNRFRETMKTVKLNDSEVVRNEALAILTTFVALVDSYVPLWDAAEPGQAIETLEADFMVKLQDLHASLKATLIEIPSTDAFETVGRYIETRYAKTAPTYGLASIA